jgi:hypothetical protein
MGTPAPGIALEGALEWVLAHINEKKRCEGFLVRVNDHVFNGLLRHAMHMKGNGDLACKLISIIREADRRRFKKNKRAVLNTTNE